MTLDVKLATNLIKHLFRKRRAWQEIEPRPIYINLHFVLDFRRTILDQSVLNG